MFPLLVVSSFHLWLKEPPEVSLDSPPYAVSLLYATLNDVLAVRQDVCVNPHALLQDQLCHFLCLFIFLSFRAFDNPPEVFTASMRMLAQCPRPDSQPRRVFLPLQFFLIYRKL